MNRCGFLTFFNWNWYLFIDSSSCQSDSLIAAMAYHIKLRHLFIICRVGKKYVFKRDKSLFGQLVRWDAGQSPNIVSVPLKSGQLATMNIIPVAVM